MPLPAPLKSLMSAMHRPVYERRLRVLVDAIAPHLRAGDRVLDVGCGNGTLGKALRDDAARRGLAGVVVEGAERVKRGGEPIPVIAFDGRAIPAPDGAYDVVILADVLHHEEDPDHLIAECRRVSRRLLIIKDHVLQGPLARARVSFMDWAANAPYGVPCLYRYNTPAQWRAQRDRHALRPVEERLRMHLYPAGWNLVFGRGLQFLGVYEK